MLTDDHIDYDAAEENTGDYISEREPPIVRHDDLPNASTAIDTSEEYWADWTGNKFLGGYGDTPIFTIDYVTLRARSMELFISNLYARGIIRRYIDNVINTGVELESMPDADILGMSEDDADDWAEGVEKLWNIWAKEPELCDYSGTHTYAQLQAFAKQMALVIGDVLVLQHIDETTFLPKIQIIPGYKINDSADADEKAAAGNKVIHGIEIDERGKHVAFFVDQEDGGSKRVEAYGVNTGRKQAWLIYGTDHLVDEVRGQPILAPVMQSLKDIDRYRDSTQRKALVNSFVSFFIQRDAATLPSNPVSKVANQVSAGVEQTDKGPVKVRESRMSPGLIFERLAMGEKPVLLGGEGTDLAFPEFERSILSAICWSLRHPPEIMMMSFNKNYSASQAAINEYRLIVNKDRQDFGNDFCQPTYKEFLTLQILIGKIPAKGFVDALRDLSKWDILGAWFKSDWYGTIKIAADLSKTVKAYKLLIDGLFITHAQATRELTGKKWRDVVKIQKRERQLANETLGVTAEFEKKLSDGGGLSAVLKSFSDQIVEDTSERLSADIVHLFDEAAL